MIFTTLVLLAGLTLLIISGDFLVRGASSLALRMHISTLVVGLTVVAFGTSAPELFVSIRAALEGTPDIATGNVVGSNICNLALVLGVTSLIRPIQVHRDSVKIDWPVTMGASLLLFGIMQGGEISFWEGALFVVLLILYVVFLIRKSRKEHISRQALQDVVEVALPSNAIWKDVLFLALGVAGLYFGSEWFVGSARELAGYLGVTERVISITVVAVGTSLPELVTSVIASFKRESDLAIGNLLGSNIFNIFSILGFTSLIKEVAVNDTILGVDMLWMLSITLLVLPMMISKRVITRLEGGVLLSTYIVYTYFVIS
ncbi:calcium/sodium antiporter [Cesiribacter andamanensis]|uniref:Inner membrane protein yrbG n=1 Tax=Cesiribacter andamanensis AMV16 TaxID=1279009 RepID=M7N394_9BACT|nr:calcium/sodium antiporter [Cesiribacter andamanensis]EMR01747.1 Inner membrane protein yrbG [Cesiribacter andamanensis AMV16]